MSFNMNSLRQALELSRIAFRVHALEKMSLRGISRDELLEALDSAEMIKDYRIRSRIPAPCFWEPLPKGARFMLPRRWTK